ncbi:hypothetical protein RM780_12745 [Streptomyces sp. DSM 44917]|uniref:Secreted protein n=1 Tax=Streptomyces boetiae TaxID=3075541 RepID=A0ABU2L8D1_9ACTN|nr:hypothetical protein [Streptomyces sp. DSM 44917]MDT0307824.1 hypothetical protein [Streptomyces sp. DSM 44917]
MATPTKRTRSRRPAAVAAALAAGVLLSGAAASGCDLQAAVDCARLAVEVTESAQVLEQAAQAEDPQAVVDAADSVNREVQELRDEVGDADVREAADSVLEAAENIGASAEAGTVPDLTPLLDATDELSEACTP